MLFYLCGHHGGFVSLNWAMGCMSDVVIVVHVMGVICSGTEISTSWPARYFVWWL